MPTVLVINDSRFQRSIICGAVKGAGYSTLESTNAIDGIESIKNKKTDLVLMDILMPGMGGMEALKKIHEGGIKIPIVIVSADVQSNPAMGAGKIQISSFLGKLGVDNGFLRM